MFIDFPNHDFQFLYSDSFDKDALIAWLEENNITSNGGCLRRFFSNHGYNDHVLTVRRRKIWATVSRGENNILDNLPLVNIITTQEDRDRKLLVTILDSILKELGYITKGKKDPFIKYMRKRLERAITESINADVTKIDRLIDIHNCLDTFLSFDKDKMYALTFYKTINNIIMITYAHFKGIQISTVCLGSFNTLLPSYIDRRTTLNEIMTLTKFTENRLFHEHKIKEALKEAKIKLKPVVIENKEMIQDLLLELDNGATT